MKKLMLICLTAILVIACQEKETRYTQNSAQIDAFKALIADYEKGDWDAFKSHYAENAAIYRNSTDSVSPQQSVDINKESLAAMSSYEFIDNQGDLEMVVTDKGETWVNFWGNWKGTMKEGGQEFVIPVHITAQFENGKIRRSYGYWDNAPIAMAQMEMAQAAKMSDSSSME